jgi:putative tryptophan/tyrosine transport system substrate-binding protein
MRRRKFLVFLVGAAATGSNKVKAQQRQAPSLRRIGALWSLSETNPDMRARLAQFHQGLERLGWSEGKNIQLDGRFAGGDTDGFEQLAKALVDSRPEAIVAQSTPVALALLRQTRSIPIVFVSVSDPIGSGLVASLAHPGGNVTGVLLYEEGITGKWLAMLKEVAPKITRAAIVANPKTTPFDYFLQTAKEPAASLAIDIVPMPIETAADIEHSIRDFAGKPNGGLVLPPDSTNILHRDVLIALAAKHNLPSVYGYRSFTEAGGLMSYSTDVPQQNRLVASLVDRILRGTVPADLPVETPTKYETAINITAAKALGLEIPSALIARADDVIE